MNIDRLVRLLSRGAVVAFVSLSGCGSGGERRSSENPVTDEATTLVQVQIGDYDLIAAIENARAVMEQGYSLDVVMFLDKADDPGIEQATREILNRMHHSSAWEDQGSLDRAGLEDKLLEYGLPKAEGDATDVRKELLDRIDRFGAHAFENRNLWLPYENVPDSDTEWVENVIVFHSEATKIVVMLSLRWDA